MRNKKDDSQKRKDELFRQFFNYLIDKYEKDNGIKFNQTKFSDSIHFSKSLIGKWRTGERNIPRDNYYAIGEYFGISVDTYLDVKQSYDFEIFDVSAKENNEKYKFLKFYPIEDKWLSKQLIKKNIRLSELYLKNLLDISEFTSKENKYVQQTLYLRKAISFLESSVNYYYPISLGYKINDNTSLNQQFIADLQEQITMYVIKNGKGDPKELAKYYCWKKTYDDLVSKKELEFQSYEGEFLDEVINSYKKDFSSLMNYSSEELSSMIDYISNHENEEQSFLLFLYEVLYWKKTI